MSRITRTVTGLVTVTLLVASCSGDAGEPTTPSATQAGPAQLAAEVGSYDLAAGKKTRFMVGLIAGENRFVSYGTVQFAFAYLGRYEPAASGQASIIETGRFLPVPGSTAAGQTRAGGRLRRRRPRGLCRRRHLRPARLLGGAVNVDLQGQGPAGAKTTFQVLAKNQVPAVGMPAPRTRNLTVAATGVAKQAIDSRARTEGKIPDPELHQTTIAQAIAQRRPLVAVFSTPVYCVSQFCGPITDLVAELAPRYPRAAFVHVEVWQDFEKRQVNKAAADWLLRQGDLHEPWVFVIGPDGKITARFDNVASSADLEAALERLPTT